jgi:hypothetical protein
VPVKSSSTIEHRKWLVRKSKIIPLNPIFQNEMKEIQSRPKKAWNAKTGKLIDSDWFNRRLATRRCQ